MLIEIVLILLGVLTFGLGVWNLVIGAYIWGTLFLIGGLWSVSLGTYYIVKGKKEKKPKIEKEPFIDINVDQEEDINAPILEEPIFSSVDVPIEDKTQEELNEFNKAVSFTNDVIPESSINEGDFEEMQIDLNPIEDDVDRNVEVIQDLVNTEPEELVEETIEVEEINLDDEEIKDSDVKFEN